MKKLVLSLFSIITLMFFVTSCSQSIEQQEVKPSVSKMSTEEKMKWIESIVSKYHQSKGSRVASFCPGGVQFLGDLGTLACSSQFLNIPANVNCGVYSFKSNDVIPFGYTNYGYGDGTGLDIVSAGNSNSAANPVNTNIYIIKDDGTLLGYGVNQSISYNFIPGGTQCNLVFFKTESGDCSYPFGTIGATQGTSCSDLWQF